MITDKLNDKLIAILYDSRLEIDSYQESIDKIFKLFTPKLKWKQSSSILWKTRPGQGTFSRRIHLRENGKYQVTGNEGTFDDLLVKRLLFDTLEEAKQYCNQEALDNFLKLCR